jgi:hypothetical protein
MSECKSSFWKNIFKIQSKILLSDDLILFAERGELKEVLALVFHQNTTYEVYEKITAKFNV